MNRYEEAKKIYAELGVDTDAAIKALKTVPVSLHSMKFCFTQYEVPHPGRPFLNQSSK